MILGSAPAGPAGTGKTETTKDLAKALAMQCVVFNCSDGLDFKAMAKFFKGLAACGAWACYDEFNRINIEVLSVIGQQISTIQLAIKAGIKRIVFEESEINVSPRFGVFITMNPGYAGRSALPDSLSALFRPVAMMVPDYALIGEIMFIAYGFTLAKECGAKMVTTFKLCSEQCSSQPHYDYGMRAVTTVIRAVGNLKRGEPEGDEMVLLLRGLQDVNVPKFLDADIPLFAGIISDLFPGKARPELDYGALYGTMKYIIQIQGLQPNAWFITKVIQLYEMIVVRHGLMLVGPTGGGKSSCLHVLEATLGELKNRQAEGFAYEKIIIYQLNPKSITMGQMYGEFDPNTREWHDGIMSTMYRKAASSPSADRKWIMFDGPVDAIWIENMNTVLDDNKKLCLVSGEAIKMSGEMTMMFEVEDLTVASPATVSRVGIIYMEPTALGLDVLILSWLDRLPEGFSLAARPLLMMLFDVYMVSCLAFLRTYLKELVPTKDNNLCESLMRIMDCYLEPFHNKEGRDVPPKDQFDKFEANLEALFMFALIWSVGATTDEAGRHKFDAMLRGEMSTQGSKVELPKTGDIYSFTFDQENSKWVEWMTTVDTFKVDRTLSFSELIVPTADSVRNTYLLALLLKERNHVLMVGETGTGKTVNISQYLSGSSTVAGEKISDLIIPLAMTFSAQTSANMTQDTLDGKVEKRRRGVFGPPAGKCMVIHVDDLNMPKREEYGAQPPIELLRQWFDQEGWFDRAGDLAYRRIVDIFMVASMGPPGGGRQEVTPRFIRHFSVIGYVEMSDISKSGIFNTILGDFLSRFEGPVGPAAVPIVASTIEIFNTILATLLPTPAKSHYTFNLRDLAKVIQGVLMGEPKRITEQPQILRLWVHELKRVFEDRLISAEDHTWFVDLLEKQLLKHFGAEWKTIVPNDRLIYGDYMEPGADPKLYDEVPDLAKLQTTIVEYLTDHNTISKSPMPLVMFLDAIEHVSRVSRILRQPQGNALLLGVGGSGRQSMTKLATFIAGFSLFQVEISKGYGMTEWREDLRKCLLNAGVKDKQTTFLFSDVQIVMEQMLEDVNNILNAGDVPNLYGPEEMDAIVTTCRVECQKKRLPPTKMNIFNQYIIRVRRNLHICLCMSPLGEAFRDRLRMFPSLVNCCTIDWFSEWPAEALQSVGTDKLVEAELGLGDQLGPVVAMCRVIHQSVELKSKEFFEVLRRHNYVTPTSYLELLGSYIELLQFKREEVDTKRQRLKIGLDKISTTKSQVSALQTDLVELQPLLVVKGKEVDEMMIVIAKDKEEADKVKAKVMIQEEEANTMAAAAKEISDDAQADLDEALPALAAATECLKNLKKAHIDEVKALANPPGGVKLTLEVTCLYFEIAPIKKNDPDNPGQKIEDYFEAGKKGLLTDANKFLGMLQNFDKDNIKDKIIKRVAPYMKDENYTPAKIKSASVACEAICMWSHAMYKYHFVAIGVAPKKAKLAEAQATLDGAMASLNEARSKLQKVVDKLDALEVSLKGAVDEKASLAAKETECKVRLSNADKLIGGLGGEEARWKITVETLNASFTNLTADVLVSAGTISYLGPFTSEFRQDITSAWRDELTKIGLPNTEGADIIQTLVDPVKLQKWQILQLPSDNLSTQNGIMMSRARRWSLMIDPQGQANRYIRNQGKDKDTCANGMDVTKLSEKNFLRTLENAVRFGKWVLLENIGEVLDAALEPILLKQIFKQGGQDMIKLGDNTIPYNDEFNFFLTTKLPNPHYSPEVQVKVSLTNFTVTPTGLEEQLLGVTVELEMPDLAEKKSNLVVEQAALNKQMYDIESQILFLLANSTGNILDDTNLIETLAQAKITGNECSEQMAEAEKTAIEIDERSEEYRPVANRAALLFFCLADLANVDPMYQYALPWFTQLFRNGVQRAPQGKTTEERLENLNSFFTFMVYQNVCRSLFEMHKMLFSFLLTIKIMMGAKKIDMLEWRFTISGVGTPGAKVEMANPDPDWIESNVWNDLCVLGGLPAFKDFPVKFTESLVKWKRVFDSVEPHVIEFPAPYGTLSGLKRLCVLRCLRRDKLMDGIQLFVIGEMGQKYVEPPPFDLRACYDDSTITNPLVFILSTGSDPNKDLLELAEGQGMLDKLKSIALGQGQGVIAAKMIEKGMTDGDWVLLQNCHLCISWMPELERIVEEMDPEKIHPDFRLWLTSMPSKAFPTPVLQNSVKMTKEPPRGLRANLKTTYLKLDDAKLSLTDKPMAFRKLMFGLCFFHALAIERKKFGPLGWNVGYSFNETDLDICASQLELYIGAYEEVPYKVLQQLTSVVNYGGRITDDKDMRTADIIVNDFLIPKMLSDNYKFSRSGTYFSINPDPDAPHKSYMEYIDSLPLNPDPEVFGMHDNAAITCAMNEAEDNCAIIVSLQPRVSSGGGLTREDVMAATAKEMEKKLPAMWDLEAVSMQFPTTYSECLNTTLVQETTRFNALLKVMHRTLYLFQLALKGLVVLSAELEAMGNALFDMRVPDPWVGKAYPSLKPLTAWFEDLVRRLVFLQTWIEQGNPPVYWLSGFFFPQGFMTANLQNHARKHTLPIDTVSFSYLMMSELAEELVAKPEDGCYVDGLFIEGARWEKRKRTLQDPRPKELFSVMPVIHLVPEQDRKTPTQGIYRCPVYKILTRTGTLSTTGHSTNFVFWLEVPSTKPTIFRSSLVSETNAQVQFCDQDYWIKGGVAAFCALRY